MKYKAVLFDMDGVIVDSEPIHFAAFQNVLKTEGHRLTESQFKKYFMGRTDKAGFQLYYETQHRQINIQQLVD